MSASAPGQGPQRHARAPRFRLSSLPEGVPAALGYAENGTWVDPGGRRTALPRQHGILDVTSWRGGFLIGDSRWLEGTRGVADVDGRETVRAWGSPGFVALSHDRGDVAWSEFTPAEVDGRARSMVSLGDPGSSGSRRTQSLRFAAAVVGVSADTVVFAGTFAQGVWRTDLRTPPTRIRALAYGTEVSPDGRWVIGGTRSPEADAGESVLVGLGSGGVVWRAGAWSLSAFSPDSSRVVGVRYTSGGLPAEWGVFDADDGRLLHRFAMPTGALVNETVWEDRRHLLMVVIAAEDIVPRRRTAAIVRVSLDGRLERASPIVPTRPAPPGSPVIRLQSP